MSDVRSAPSATQSWLPVAGAIALAVVVGLGLLGSYAIVLYKLRNSPAGGEAHLQIVENAQLKALLGAPLGVKIEAGDLQHEGQASFTMRVRGSKASAMVEMQSREEGSGKARHWRIVSGTITVGERELPLEPGEPAAVARADAGPELPDAGPGHLDARGPQP